MDRAFHLIAVYFIVMNWVLAVKLHFFPCLNVTLVTGEATLTLDRAIIAKMVVPAMSGQVFSWPIQY